MPDGQLLQGVADLSQGLRIHRTARNWHVKAMRAWIALERAEQPVRLNRFPQSAKARHRALPIDEEGLVDPVRCVVHSYDRVDFVA